MSDEEEIILSELSDEELVLQMHDDLYDGLNDEIVEGVNILLERNWIKLSGYREVPGRPALYVTTKDFLNDLSLKNISELPDLPESIDSNDIDLLSKAV